MVSIDNIVFGLDIGTRSIVGVAGYLERNRFNVVAMAEKQHETRAMLDGQIHDIYKVGDTIRYVKNQLEKQLGFELKDVCIAAAGRVLKTMNVSTEYEFEEETRVNSEHIYSLNLMAVEKAHTEINAESKTKYYCIGNTPMRYHLNDYEINNLEGHKANKIGVELIATFLPEEVVDGLYEAVNYAGLEVASLTLEPIAAMNIAIPEQFRLLNIALIDVGAGTSDICITKDGMVVAYGMIPYAGDEITEVIAKNYLVDFNAAEKIKINASKKKGVITFKDIMGISQKVNALDVRAVADKTIEKLAKAAGEKIMELNGGKPVNAVFVVGGGGKIPGYTDKVAASMKLPKERVAVRGEEVLTSVDFNVENFKKDSLYVTPVGICTNYYTQKNNFVFVTVNGQRIKLYDNNNLSVVDAIMQIGYPNEKLFPRRGAELTFTINGKTRLVRGKSGEGAVIKLNGKSANLNTHIEQNDAIEVTESSIGAPAEMTVGQLEEFNSIIEFIVNDKKVSCPKFAYVNDELKSQFYDIKSGDSIKMENYYTVKQLFEFLDYDSKDMKIYVNNELATDDTKVYENFNIKTSFEELKFEKPVFENSSIDDEHADNNDADNDIENEVGDETADTSSNPSANAVNTVNTPDNKEIFVSINKTPVKLTGKPSYVLVDIFDFYPFDLKNPQGTAVVITLNGQRAEYMAPISDSDIIELYWEK